MQRSLQSFSFIRARAEKRKGGPAALAALLPPPPDLAALERTPDDRILAEMARRIFSAGFVWSVVEAKWPGFEAAFEGFDPARLAFEPDEFRERLASDARIIRNGPKIAAVFANAAFVARVSKREGGFGAFLARWPADDQAGLLAALSKQGARLGGMTGQYFLRFVGWDAFILSRDVVACLRDAGVDLSEKATSNRDLEAAQTAFAQWRRETGVSWGALSKICAFSIGENRSAGPGD